MTKLASMTWKEDYHNGIAPLPHKNLSLRNPISTINHQLDAVGYISITALDIPQLVFNCCKIQLIFKFVTNP